MNRNPEYQFVSTDTNTIVASMVAAYERITDITVAPASPERLFIQWVADVIIQERVLNNYTGNQNLPSRAEGENLDALAQLFKETTRPEAQPAVSTQRFHISAAQSTSIIVPMGTRVTDASTTLVWETDTDVYIGIGELFADVAIHCQTPGVVGNGFALGQINTLIDIGNVAFFARTENITVSDKGADRATDEAFFNLLRESNKAYTTAGASGAYVFHARRVSTEIADVVANSPSAGQVNLYVLMDDGTIASPVIKDEVYKACSPDDVRPLTDSVVVDDPEQVEYDIEFTFYVPGRADSSTASIDSAVRAATDGYAEWQSSKLGRDINPDELRQRVREAGVKRIVLTSPEFTVLRDGRDHTVPQVAKIRNITIVNGGNEDE